MSGTDRVADRRTNIYMQRETEAEIERDSYRVIERPYAGFHQALLYYCIHNSTPVKVTILDRVLWKLREP
jgi:hypothetical protein